MKKVFICADVKFPHGDAGSNRIQNIAKSLVEIGYKPIVVSHGKNYENERDSEGRYHSSGIEYVNVAMRNGGIGGLLDQKVNGGKLVLKKAIELGLGTDDIVYLYGSNATFMRPIINHCKKQGIRMFADVVEWHQPHQYKYGKWDLRFLSINYTYTHLYEQTKNVIAISECIYKYFAPKCENMLLLPVTIDGAEYADRVLDNKHEVINLIYPGNPCRENFANMLRAIQMIEKNRRERLKLHITGVKKESVNAQLGKDAKLLDELSDLVVFHGWMEYADLQKLYEDADFLFMCRPNDLVKQANFPSKLPELMLRGIAPICNKVGDYWTYLSDENAVIFEHDDATECCGALLAVLSMSDDSINKMKLAARECAKEKFDYHKWSDKIRVFMEGLK